MSALTAATDLAWLTVAYAAELLRTKKLSPVEYAKALIARSERHDPHYNAYLRATPELALADAQRAEAEIMRGEWRGPFHGVPYGLKDIVDYAGLPTTDLFTIGVDVSWQQAADVLGNKLASTLMP